LKIKILFLIQFLKKIEITKRYQKYFILSYLLYLFEKDRIHCLKLVQNLYIIIFLNKSIMSKLCKIKKYHIPLLVFSNADISVRAAENKTHIIQNNDLILEIIL